MAHDFDPGPAGGPFAPLFHDFPGTDSYPPDDFRTEWGPIFYRGRLDGSARVLVLGQDPAEQETICRRILVGEAGHRAQGMLGKLGLDRSYLLVNTYVYSVFGQAGGEAHIDDPKIAEYRHRWLAAAFAHNKLEAVVALGHLADSAWTMWVNSLAKPPKVAFAHLTHPTQPESSSRGDPAKRKVATEKMLVNWNEKLAPLHAAIKHPDRTVDFVPYGTDFAAAERLTIPEGDLPPGLPDWMRSPHSWADRTGTTPAMKRRTITVKVPAS